MNKKKTQQHRKIDYSEIFTAEITDLTHEGRGIARINGKVVFIKNALPNETVQFHYTRKHNSHDEATATQIIKPSPDRVTPQCLLTDRCGGCSLQHIKHSQQVHLKETIFIELLQQAKIQPPELVAPLIAQDYHYRRKARLSVRYIVDKGAPLVGFREQNGRYITDMQRCPILAEPFDRGIQLLRDLINQLDSKMNIPQIEITAADNYPTIIIRHLSELTAHDKNCLKEFGQKNNWFIYLQPKDYDSIYLFFPEKKSDLYYELPEFNLRLTVEPQQFMQINRSINMQMLNQALTWLDLNENDQVLDLFCGIGNFSLPIARTTNRVTGVEADISAVNQAKYNANLNAIKNSEFFATDLFAINTIKQSSWFDNQYNKLLLDPPRSGAKEMIELFADKKLEKIVYVSCNPATFCRDASILHAQGYCLEKAGILDMFPHTQHLEVMGLFTWT